MVREQFIAQNRPAGKPAPDMSVTLSGLKLDNPVVPASGTFGYGNEFRDFYDINILGSFSFKGTTREPRFGNPTPRIAECTAGMINAVGLQNPGIDHYLAEDLPKLKAINATVIANVAGHCDDDYVEVVSKLNDSPADMLEINVSCPNVSAGGMSVGTDPVALSRLITRLRKLTDKKMIVKLTPNVTDITEIAKAAEAAGADGISLINTLLGMAVDARTRRPKLARVVGGYSGPAVKPVALRMVWQVAQAVSVPVLGMGGISTGEDAVEFMLAGATAVAVGTANFVNPTATVDVIDGIIDYCESQGVKDVNELIGALQC